MRLPFQRGLVVRMENEHFLIILKAKSKIPGNLSMAQLNPIIQTALIINCYEDQRVRKKTFFMHSWDLK